MSEILDKAQEVLDEEIERKNIRKFLKEEHSISSKREIEFYIEFIRTGQAYKSYQKIYAPTMKRGSAAVLANRIINKHKITFLDWLEYAGHGTDAITEALDQLREKDPDAYLKHITKFKQLDIQKVEHSGTINLPNTVFTSNPDEIMDEEEAK